MLTNVIYKRRFHSFVDAALVGRVHSAISVSRIQGASMVLVTGRHGNAIVISTGAVSCATKVTLVTVWQHQNL